MLLFFMQFYFNGCINVKKKYMSVEKVNSQSICLMKINLPKSINIKKRLQKITFKWVN